MWLDCSFFGLFPIADSINNIKSKLFDTYYYYKKCLNIFMAYSDNITFDYTEATNLNSAVGYLSKTLLVSTNSKYRKALS